MPICSELRLPCAVIASNPGAAPPPPPPTSTLFPSTTLFRSHAARAHHARLLAQVRARQRQPPHAPPLQRRHHVDRKSTRLNSSHMSSSYAVFCLKKTKRTPPHLLLPRPIPRPKNG